MASGIQQDQGLKFELTNVKKTLSQGSKRAALNTRHPQSEVRNRIFNHPESSLQFLHENRRHAKKIAHLIDIRLQNDMFTGFSYEVGYEQHESSAFSKALPYDPLTPNREPVRKRENLFNTSELNQSRLFSAGFQAFTPRKEHLESKRSHPVRGNRR